ncbi:hypothetical protein SDC9_207854 [bioreactor metagenome]|uniref:Uncharacterized protein n=1 Tax=bioreactor metagenome TaxID=1076179 RepID=A0A645JBI6_9ZZZZ
MINEFFLFKTAAALTAHQKKQVGVDDRLTPEGVAVIVQRNADIGKDLQIRFPADFRAGILFGVGFLFQPADIFAVFKMQGI